jgi:hypothetical protein
MSDTPEIPEEEPVKDVEDYTDKELDDLHYDMSEVPIYYEHG